MSTDASTFLLGSGGKSAKFETIGDTVKGTICAPPELRQKTDIKDGTPLTWQDGSPQMQLVVKLQTDEHDPTDPDDDGVRALYVSGGFKRMSLQKAIAEAVRTSKAKGLEIGGTLAVRFTGEEPPTTKGFSPAKLYAAQYQPPTQKAADDFLGTATPATAANDFSDAPF